MSSTEHAGAAAGRPILPLLAMLLALAGLFGTVHADVARGVVRDAVARDLGRITALANLRTPTGRGSPTATMPVMVVQEGGPLWISEQAEAAVEADPIFVRGEPHLLRIEVVENAGTYGIRGQLWRQGWSLRAPQPLWVGPAPWVVWFAALAGAGWAAYQRRVFGGLVVSGVTAQLLTLGLPWAPGFVRPTLVQRWSEGPLGDALVTWSRALPDASVAIGAGVVTLCAVLMVFDHRRSPGEGGGTVAAGLLGVFGLLAWIEASLRSGLWPWLHQPAGVTALVGVVGVWWWAAGRRRVPQEPTS